MNEITKKRLTYEDYAKLPEGAPYQLIGAVLVKSPSPVPNHQIIVKKLFVKLMELEKTGLGTALFSPLDVFLEDTETYQPDLIFILWIL